jgi:hypothetical protein
MFLKKMTGFSLKRIRPSIIPTPPLSIRFEGMQVDDYVGIKQ